MLNISGGVNLTTANNGNTVKKSETEAHELPELVVLGNRVKQQKTLNVDVELKAPQINATRPNPTAIDMIERCGGKLQERKVNGVKQQIAIIKNNKKEMKYLVNPDGTLGEKLVTLSTFGKNTYITQSEHERRMNTIFPTGIPEGIEVKYAYQDGIYHPRFLKDGKYMSNSDLRVYIAEINQKSNENYAQL